MRNAFDLLKNQWVISYWGLISFRQIQFKLLNMFIAIFGDDYKKLYGKIFVRIILICYDYQKNF